jgi:hypothetical protein
MGFGLRSPERFGRLRMLKRRFEGSDDGQLLPEHKKSDSRAGVTE